VIICEGILGVYGFDWFVFFIVGKTTCVHVGRGV
jgi:hypothetical protein